MNNDEQMERQIQDLGLVSPRVTLDHVNNMLNNRVTYQIAQPAGTTSTFAHAFLDGQFYLASGHTACVSRDNFDAQLGQQHAVKNAQALATDKLYELEGYVLYTQLSGG